MQFAAAKHNNQSTDGKVQQRLTH